MSVTELTCLDWLKFLFVVYSPVAVLLAWLIPHVRLKERERVLRARP